MFCVHRSATPRMRRSVYSARGEQFLMRHECAAGTSLRCFCDPDQRGLSVLWRLAQLAYSSRCKSILFDIGFSRIGNYGKCRLISSFLNVTRKHILKVNIIILGNIDSLLDFFLSNFYFRKLLTDIRWIFKNTGIDDKTLIFMGSLMFIDTCVTLDIVFLLTKYMTSNMYFWVTLDSFCS